MQVCLTTPNLSGTVSSLSLKAAVKHDSHGLLGGSGYVRTSPLPSSPPACLLHWVRTSGYKQLIISCIAPLTGPGNEGGHIAGFN